MCVVQRFLTISSAMQTAHKPNIYIHTQTHIQLEPGVNVMSLRFRFHVQCSLLLWKRIAATAAAACYYWFWQRKSDWLCDWPWISVKRIKWTNASYVVLYIHICSLIEMVNSTINSFESTNDNELLIQKFN